MWKAKSKRAPTDLADIPPDAIELAEKQRLDNLGAALAKGKIPRYTPSPLKALTEESVGFRTKLSRAEKRRNRQRIDDLRQQSLKAANKVQEIGRT